MEEICPQRRRFFKIIKSGILLLLGLPLLGKYLLTEKGSGRSVLEVDKDEIPGDGALVSKEKKVALVNTEDELIALSLVCTHLGCTVNINARDIVCPCHGSRFNHRGEVLRGPARENLRHLDLLRKGPKILVKK